MSTAELAPLWSCATSLRMCLSGAAPHGPARAEVIRDVHVRQLVVAGDGDTRWLAAAASAAHRRARAGARLGGGLALARRRLGRSGHRRWRFALRALTPRSRAEVAAQWTDGARIAEAAAALLDGAGDDPAALARVLADARRVLARVDWDDLVGRGSAAALAAATRDGAEDL